MEGRVDIAIAAMGMPIVGEANARVGIRFLPVPVDPGAIRRHQSILPGTTIALVPPGLPGVKVATPSGQIPIAVVSSTHMPDHVAYAFVKTLWDHHEKLAPIHPQFRGWKPDIYISKLATVPFHTGAIKFYKEKNV